MAYCRPSSQFCCGCSVVHGVQFILLLHFAVNALLLIEAVGMVFMPERQWASSDYFGIEVFLSGYALVGFPLIAAASWGVVSKTESFLRVYMFYLWASFVMDSYFIIKIFLASGPCEGTSKLMQAVGSAFACGVARAVNSTIVSLLWGIQLYFIYVVWSYVEDLATGAGPDLSDLVCDEEVFMQKRRQEDPFAAIVGLGEHVPDGYGSIYDAAADGGLGGSERIFGGRQHEMQYPPPRALLKKC